MHSVTTNGRANVRQLENTVERAVALEMTDELHVEVPANAPRRAPAAAGLGTMDGVSDIAPGAVLPEGVGMEVTSLISNARCAKCSRSFERRAN